MAAPRSLFGLDRRKFLAGSLVAVSCTLLGAVRPMIGQQTPVSAGRPAPELIDDLMGEADLEAPTAYALAHSYDGYSTNVPVADLTGGRAMVATKYAGQPLAAEIEEAATRAGIAYRHVPILRGIGPGDVEAMKEALAEAGEGKTLAFCRSGTRSAMVCALAHRELGASREEVEARLARAGFDSGPIQHLL